MFTPRWGWSTTHPDEQNSSTTSSALKVHQKTPQKTTIKKKQIKRSSWQHTSCSMTVAEIHVVIVIQSTSWNAPHTRARYPPPNPSVSQTTHHFPCNSVPSDTKLSAAFEFCWCCSAENCLGPSGSGPYRNGTKWWWEMASLSLGALPVEIPNHNHSSPLFSNLMQHQEELNVSFSHFSVCERVTINYSSPLTESTTTKMTERAGKVRYQPKNIHAWPHVKS